MAIDYSWFDDYQRRKKQRLAEVENDRARVQKLLEAIERKEKYARTYALLKEIVAYIGNKITEEELPECVKDAAVFIAEEELDAPGHPEWRKK